MIHIEDVLLHSLAQDGDKYVFGAAPDFNDPDPREFDCSGLVRWSLKRAGGSPALPHSSFMQCQICMKNVPTLEISIADGVATRGALLFKFLDDAERPITDVLGLTARPAKAHVAWSLGNGTTIEAMGSKWGVGTFTSDPAKRGWTHAGLAPGIDYGVRPQRSTTTQQPEEDDMSRVMFMKGVGKGEVHAYVVTGGVGKLLSPEALRLHDFFKTERLGSLTEPLGKEWQDGVAILDGPLRNVPPL